jgi:hypothetical protein
VAQPAVDRLPWLRDVRLDAHARHMALNPQGDMVLHRSLHKFLELDDPLMREMTRAGVWK